MGYMGLEGVDIVSLDQSSTFKMKVRISIEVFQRVDYLMPSLRTVYITS